LTLIPVGSPLRPSSDRSPAFRLSEASDWCALVESGANVLVSGAPEPAEAFLREALPHLRAPVQHIACEEGLAISASAKTVILSNIEILNGVEQRTLLAWLDRPSEDRRVQIISRTSAPLYTYVQAQLFDETLYYRLNPIYLEVFPA
jgi:transcriptional regulator of aromatic amino acid metabolism